MKITKNSKVLQETKVSDVLDTTDSVSELADDIVDHIEDATGGEVTLSDTAASTVAADAKAAADDLGIEDGAVALPEEDIVIGVENRVTKVLDMALNTAKKNKGRKTKTGTNVLIIGLPGSGKTATIMDWARARGVNLVSVNAKNNDLEAYINGYTTKDPDKKRRVTQAFSDNLMALEEPNSVLFLDEYNRQVKPHIRASLYTLINEHKIVGEGPNNQHEFKNMLFTIAAINPAVPTDKGAADLNDAEKSRFWWTLDDMDSDEETTIEYLTKYYNKLISTLSPEEEDYLQDLEDYLRIQDLGLFIVSHPKFDYDTRDDLEDLSMTPPGWKHGSKPNLLCQRSLTQGLHNADGDVDIFRFWVENGAKFLDRDTETLLKILKEYVKPSFEDLCAGHGIDPTSIETLKASAAAASVEEAPTATPEESGVEDDDDFFTDRGRAGTVRAKNPYEVELAIANALKEW